MNSALRLIAALAVTEIVECTVYAVWFRSIRQLWPVFLCNLFTNPLMNISLLFITSLTGNDFVHYVSLVFLESCVVISEAVLLGYMLEIKRGKAFLLSLLLNGASYFTGILLSAAGVF